MNHFMQFFVSHFLRMPFEEFMNNFDQIQICHLGPETALAGVRIVNTLPTISISQWS